MSLPPLHLGILFHMHQPSYVEPEGGPAGPLGAPPCALLPWVRLHGAAGYLDVATVLREHPGARLTINFVPSLLAQLQAVVAGQRDRYLDLAERSETDFDLADRVFLLSRFFSINWSRAVDPRPRYRELLDKRGRTASPDEVRRRAPLFTPQELRDLTVLFHLAWLGFAVRRGDEALAELERRGGGYTLDDLRLVTDRSRAACARVLPLYRELADRGQIELLCSPYYHPIVPLLCDSAVAAEAQPAIKLPPRFQHPEDAREQIRRGRAAFTELLGRPAGGMWPPEGSISPAALACYEEEGTPFLVSDEGNLWRSLGPGAPSGAAALCRPYRFGKVALFFRARELSDRIGFRYAQDDAAAAVGDLLQGVSQLAPPRLEGSDEVPIVTLALDGENPWESYPGRGEPFLTALFARLAEQPRVGEHSIRPVTFSEHLGQQGQERKTRPVPLARLHAGSWIDSDFHIWISDPVKNRAWDLLGRARAELARAQKEGTVDAAALERAYERLLCAEGSDWFWWFGEPFHSDEDSLYDRLFRDYLAAAYRALGRPVPADLLDPVDEHLGKAQAGLLLTPPQGFIHPQIDGRRTHFYEWDQAGCYRVPSGSAMAERPDLCAIYFGFDREHLYLRVDPVEAALFSTVTVVFELQVGDAAKKVACTPGAAGLLPLPDGGSFAAAENLEAALPWAAVGAAPGQELSLVVRLFQGAQADRPRSRYPRDGAITLRAPDDGFIAGAWIMSVSAPPPQNQGR